MHGDGNDGYQGLEGGEVESYCIMGTEFPFRKTKKFQRWMVVIIS